MRAGIQQCEPVPGVTDHLQRTGVTFQWNWGRAIHGYDEAVYADVMLTTAQGPETSFQTMSCGVYVDQSLPVRQSTSQLLHS